MTTSEQQEQETETREKKRGRGLGQKKNRRFSLLVQHPDRVSERIIVKVYGRSSDSLDERHRRLLLMQQYCYTHDILYRWFLASPGEDEHVLYLTIDRMGKAKSRVKDQVSRLKLTSEQVSMTPIIGATTEPCVPKTKRVEVPG